MRDWKAALLAGLLLATTPACVSAYDRALDRGHALVAQKKYRDAYAAYRQAAKHDPDEAEVQRLLAQIRPYAIEEATEDARASVSAGAYEAAAKHADFVAGLDAQQGAELHGEVRRWMRAALQSLVQHGQMAEAYPLAIRSHRLYPKMEGLLATFDRLRKHFLAQSDAALAKQDYRGAIENLDIIAKYEPNLERTMLAERRTRVKNAWADHVVTLAQKAEADQHLGAATALYARAFEVAGRPADRQAMTDRLRILAEEGRFTVLLHEESGTARSPLGPAVAADLRSLNGVRVSTEAEEGTLLLTLTSAPYICSQSHTTSTASQTYQSGTRRVSNPAYTSIVSNIATVQGRLASVEADITRLRPEMRRHGRDHRRCLADDLAPKEAAQRAAQATFDAAKADVAAQQVVVDNLRRRWQQAQGAQKDELRRQLDDAEAELARRKSQRDAARRALNTAESDVSSARSRCASHERSLTRVQGDLQRHQGSRADIVAELAQLEADRAATPSEIDEPVYSELSYPVEHHARRCDGPVTVDLEPAWTKPTRRHLKPAGITEDDSHGAYPVAGVQADPLAFPVGDHQLRQDADQAATTAVKSIVATLVKDFYADMSARAVELSATSPHEATDMMLSIYVAAPYQFTKEDRSRIAKHLRDQYGLEKIDVLLK